MASTMRFDKWENTLGQQYGTVLQVVQYRRPANESGTSGSLLASATNVFATFMSASITPRFSTSKILVNTSFYVYNASGTATSGESRLLRDSTYIDGLTYSTAYNLGNTFIGSHMSVLDSPNTTSQITYNVQGSRTNGSTLLFGYADSGGTEHASITLFEIAA